MIWALLIFIFAVLLQAGAGYAVGDIMSHALSYDLTRKTAIWEGLLIILLLLLKAWLEYHFAPEKRSKAAFLLPESVIWFVGTILLAVTLELYTDLGIPVQIAAMLLFTVCSLVFERDTYLQYFRVAEEGEESRDEEEDEYTFAADRKDDRKVGRNEERKEASAEEDGEEFKNTRVIAEDDEILLEVVEDADPAGDAETENLKAQDAPELVAKAEGLKAKAINEAVGEGKAEGLKAKAATETSGEGKAEKTVESGRTISKNDTEEDGEDGEGAENTAQNAVPAALAGFYVGARVIAYVASLLIGILAFVTLHDSENRIRAYIIMLVGAIVTVIFRLVPGEIMEDRITRKRIIYATISVMVTVFLCTRSVLVGLIFLLNAFLVGVIIPMATYRFAIGGTDVVEKKTDILSRITSRVLLAVILVISAWLLSYGALWEYEFLMILGTTFAAQELLLKQSLRLG